MCVIIARELMHVKVHLSAVYMQPNVCPSSNLPMCNLTKQHIGRQKIKQFLARSLIWWASKGYNIHYNVYSNKLFEMRVRKTIKNYIELVGQVSWVSSSTICILWFGHILSTLLSLFLCLVSLQTKAIVFPNTILDYIRFWF